MTRTVRAIVGFAGQILGAVPQFDVGSPWWADTEPVAVRLGELLGVQAVVLRLLGVRGGEPMRDGAVSYLAEVRQRPQFPFAPVPERELRAVTDPQPLRAPYAEPGGVYRVLRWADEELTRIGRPRTGPFRQIKTWNLSHVVQLPTADEPVWCKTVRSFETAEHTAIAVVARHDPQLAPAVLAAGADVTLSADAGGADSWDAGAELIGPTVRRWVGVQAALAETTLPDIPQRTPATLADRLSRVLEAAPLTDVERAAAVALATATSAYGLPMTLVHGDLHTGNWRWDGTEVTILDWSGAYIGHPADDLVTLVQRLDPVRAAGAVEAWSAAWRSLVPGCDPGRALATARPLVHLEKAALYQRFLDHIEPAEQIYHHADPADQVRLALRTANAAATGKA